MKEFLINLGIKTRIYLLAISGFLSSFAFAPYHQLWILFFSVSILAFFGFYSESYKRSFVFGYVFGFFLFLGGLYWIANALFVDIDAFFYLVPLAIIVIPMLLAFYLAILMLILHRLNNRSSFRFILLFICLWVLIECLRTYLFTGFPWLLLGYSLMFSDALIQSASVFGIFGLSALVVSCTSLPFLLIHLNKSNLFLIIVIVCISVINLLFGMYRLKAPTQYFDKHIVVVQPNISQKDKMNSYKIVDNLNKLVNLTSQPKDYVSKSSYIIWPETALGHYYRDPVVKQIIGNILPKDHFLITGVDRVSENKIYNSVMLFNHKGETEAYYDKFHLVPFGEYLPFRKLLPSMMHNLSNGLIDFEAGSGPRTITVESMPSFSPLICYETLFPKEIVHNEIKPEILINFTNDAWYGLSPGPYQHFEMTRLRAVEFGLPMVRASNTGISAIIDSYGRVLAYLSLNTSGMIQKKIPRPLEYASIFSKYGNTTIILLMIIIVSIALLLRGRDMY